MTAAQYVILDRLVLQVELAIDPKLKDKAVQELLDFLKTI